MGAAEMTVEMFPHIQQGTPEWYRIRAGLATASQFKTVKASGKAGGDSVTRRKYMLQLAGEIITGEPMESFSNGHMERGKRMEAEARAYYAFQHDEEPELIGFARDTEKGCGCSPDSLLGKTGLLEIKTHLPHILAEMILSGKPPSTHKAQVQGQLHVTDREFVDLLCYWPKFPPFDVRWYRDEPYIRQLAADIAAFNEELLATVEKIKRLGGV